MVCKKTGGPRWLLEPWQRLTARPRGSPWLMEVLRRLTEGWRTCTGAGDNGVGGGGPRSAQVDPGPVLGPVSWYAAVQVCRCASVPVIVVVYQYTGVQYFRWFRYDFPSIVFCVCYNHPMIFFSSPYVCLRLPIVCLWFPMFSFRFSGCSYGLAVNFLWYSYASRWFS